MPGPPPPPPKGRPEQSYIDIVQAKFAYEPQNPDELKMEPGDVLYVLNKDDPNWWKCKIEERQGLVPANYITEHTTQLDNPLHEASKRGNLAFVKELLAANVSINTFDKAKNTPLHWAARSGHKEIVSALLSAKGQQPAINAQNKLGDTPLHSAAWGGNPEVVSLLLSFPGIDVK